jgi:hypothetical protein
MVADYRQSPGPGQYRPEQCLDKLEKPIIARRLDFQSFSRESRDVAFSKYSQ